MFFGRKEPNEDLNEESDESSTDSKYVVVSADREDYVII
jgi:hypothetical protein